MKKLIFAFALIAALLSTNAQAGKFTKDMLDQVVSINFSWRPVVGGSIYTRDIGNGQTILVIGFYDNSKPNADPEKTDIQAEFVKTGKGSYLLAGITFGSFGISLPHLDALQCIEQLWPAK